MNNHGFVNVKSSVYLLLIVNLMATGLFTADLAFGNFAGVDAFQEILTTASHRHQKMPSSFTRTFHTLATATGTQTRATNLHAIKIDGYDDAFAIIDECAVNGQPNDELYDAVRFIDKKAIQIYPDESHKQELWDSAHGSWKLQLATGGGKATTFKPIPIFAFAVIDDNNFGNGVGFNQDNIILSLLGPHIFNPQRRQMTITIDDMFLFSNQVTDKVPGFMKDGMGIGKRPEDFKKAPAFTYIGASDKALIARGGTGGIAIWTRLSKDIRPAAYGSSQ